MSVPFFESLSRQAKMGRIQKVNRISGGDINNAYCIETTSGNFFLKINSAEKYPRMFEKEANGLRALAGIPNCILPQVISVGEVEGNQYLMLDWLEKGEPGPSFWENFGSALSELHRRTSLSFGLDEDNYIGSLHQSNKRKETWADFYGEERLMPLVRRLRNSNSFNPSTVTSAEALCKKTPDIFPKEAPSLLHGDLWSGNFMISEYGSPSIYDPAVYYGHREMDLGMTLLFGGFDKRFYDAYHDVFPLEKNWRSRVELTQLYPLLVHAVLFGGHYIGSAERIIKRFF